MNIILLNAYLGLIVFLIGTVILIVSLYKMKLVKTIVQLFLIAVAQLIVSNIISLAIWKLWIFEMDVMLLFISYPALIAECISIPLFIYILTILQKRNTNISNKSTGNKCT